MRLGKSKFGIKVDRIGVKRSNFGIKVVRIGVKRRVPDFGSLISERDFSRTSKTVGMRDDCLPDLSQKLALAPLASKLTKLRKIPRDPA
jgi:hypothetical protein